MNKSIDLKVKRIRLVDLTNLDKRIEKFSKMQLDMNQIECYKALLENYNKGNYKKAFDIANMLDSSLNNQCICKEVVRNFKLIK